MLYVICYDIADDRRRRKLDKLLKAYGIRVQESVFEVRLTTKRLARVKNRCAAVIDPELDSVRIYRQCEACITSLDLIGIGPIPEPPLQVVVI